MKLLRGLTNFFTWGLFFASFAMLGYQTWWALQGARPNYATEVWAGIITVIISATTLAMFARVVLHMDATRLQFVVTLLLLVCALGVDVLVALSIIFGFDFPEQFALFVVIAHVVVHVVQQVIVATQQASARFANGSPENGERQEVVNAVLAQLRFTCTMCGRPFGSLRGLQQHQRSAHKT